MICEMVETRERFERVYRAAWRFAPLVANRLRIPWDVLMDGLQDIAITAWLDWERVPTSKSLIRAAIRNARDHLRRQKRMVPLSMAKLEEWEAAQPPLPRRDRLWDWIDKLEGDDRRIADGIMARESRRAIARSMDRSLNAVRFRLERLGEKCPYGFDSDDPDEE